MMEIHLQKLNKDRNPEKFEERVKKAEKHIQKIQESAAPVRSEVIEKMMKEEEEKDYQSSAQTKQQMDRRFGRGRWRCMPGSSTWRLQEKGRAIADGKRGGHNWKTSEEETLYTIGVDFVAEALRTLVVTVLQVFAGYPETEVEGLLPIWQRLY